MSSSNSNTIKAQAYFQGEIGRSPLVNKLGITAQQELEAVEAFYVEHAIVNGLSKKAQSLSPAGLCQMHYEMFGEIYEWAGEYRNCPTGRDLPFCLPEFIENSLNAIYKTVNQEITPNIDKQSFIKSAAKFIGELNVVHPFVDGNGRTQRQTLALIAQKAGFTLAISDKLVKEEWYLAAAESQATATYDRFELIIASLIE